MKNPYQYIIATLIIISGAVAVFSGYQVSRQDDNTLPADVVKTFELRHEPRYLIDYESMRSQFKVDELVDPATTLPSNTNLPAQREIYKAAKNCFQSAAPRFAPQSTEHKALIWEQYRCGKLKNLPFGFFETQPFMHFSGQSYGLLAQGAGLNVQSPFLHMREIARQQQANPSWRVIAELTRDSLKAIYLGAPLVSDPRHLVIRAESTEGNARPAQYKVYDAQIWASYLKDVGRRAQPIQHGLSDQCEQVYAAYCWTHIKSERTENVERIFKTSLTMFVGLVLGVFFVGVHRYRKRLSLIRDDRVLLARVTAHELRTPVTNLKLISSTLSRAKTMDDISQINADFNDQIRRLSILTDASRLLLDAESEPNSKKSDQASEPLKNIVSILDELSVRRGIIFENSVPSDDIATSTLPVKVNCQLGMLQLCLENLLDNAFNHGKPPITLNMTLTGNDVCLEVRDSGSFSAKASTTTGLGIGLDVVKSAMRRMGGSFEIQENPTRIKLRLRIMA